MMHLSKKIALAFFFCRRICTLVSIVFIFAGALATAQADAGSARDVLWEIVSTCLDPSVADYCDRCRWPRIETTCPHDGKCGNTTEVWAETTDYIVIRDHKMCGCPEGFVHGLALPRARVTGTEDSSRPDGIWRVAWAAAQKLISDEAAIALVVNPARLRSQDQLHVHIVRLKKDARQRLAELPVSRLQDLDGVWRAAGQGAAEVYPDDYGVLVAAHPDGGFVVRVEKGSPEWLYTIEKCQ
jgi:CDP-diacylglycerol pyrophosphatase